MSTMHTETSADASRDESRERSWLDDPTCEELAWLDTLRRRGVSRTRPDDVAGESAADHALLERRLLKHR